jgi:hypothetical protein
MGKTKYIYQVLRVFNACLLMITLFSFTVSAPYVIAKQFSKTSASLGQDTSWPASESEEESSNPMSSNNEEKVPNTNNLVEEYLHSVAEHDAYNVKNKLNHALHKAGLYTAFHGELLVPPPNC